MRSSAGCSGSEARVEGGWGIRRGAPTRCREPRRTTVLANPDTHSSKVGDTSHRLHVFWVQPPQPLASTSTSRASATFRSGMGTRRFVSVDIEAAKEDDASEEESMKQDELKHGAHENGHCAVCAAIVAAARARGVRWDDGKAERRSSPAGRIWEAAVEGRLQLVASPVGRATRATPVTREREV